MIEHQACAILPCNDIDATQAFYERLGFAMVAGDAGFRILADDGGWQIALRPAEPGWVVPERNSYGIYLYCDDVDAVAERVRDIIIERGAPHCKPWGMYEFAVGDPDGVLVRIGRPVREGSRCIGDAAGEVGYQFCIWWCRKTVLTLERQVKIKEFRQELSQAFERGGFEGQRRRTTEARLWVLPGHEVDRAFREEAIRRPWGFLLSGSLVLDVPSFRSWLGRRYDRAEHGVLWSTILGRHIANDRDLFFGSESPEEPPFDLWVATLRRKLEGLPSTVNELLHAFRTARERLEPVWGLGSECEAAMEYFELWALCGDVPLPPPQRLQDGSLRLDVVHQERLKALRASIRQH